MQSPKVPAFHFNTRFCQLEKTGLRRADMTPTLINKEDTEDFVKNERSLRLSQ